MRRNPMIASTVAPILLACLGMLSGAQARRRRTSLSGGLLLWVPGVGMVLNVLMLGLVVLRGEEVGDRSMGAGVGDGSEGAGSLGDGLGS